MDLLFGDLIYQMHKFANQGGLSRVNVANNDNVESFRWFYFLLEFQVRIIHIIMVSGVLFNYEGTLSCIQRNVFARKFPCWLVILRFFLAQTRKIRH